MCATCGCNEETKTTLLNLQSGAVTTVVGDHGWHEHIHADGTRHSHRHDHSAPHSHPAAAHDDNGDPHLEHSGVPDGRYGRQREVRAIESRILAKNDAVAAKNRAWLSGREILAINLVSSPGSGKTTLLERTIADFPEPMALAVIEGDQATANDGERIRKAGAPVTQINTGSGCHLDAEMVARGLFELKPKVGSIVLIENVGNLVCPALFDLGERAKVVLFSVTEGEDKPLKYPYMFRAAEVILINKIDLLPHVDFSLETAMAHVRAVNPNAPVLQLSARTGEGMPSWYAWLESQAATAREFAPLCTSPRV
jgi:hydrogenase nickel incorporation protein HypB